MNSSGHKKWDPVALLGFVFWRTAANFAAVKSPEKLIGVAFGVLRRSDTSFDTSRVNSRSAPSYFPFLTSRAPMTVAETGQWWRECLDLPVRLLTILYAFLLECEKSMFWTASNQRVLRFLSNVVRRVVASLLNWLSFRDCRKSWYSVSHAASQHDV